MIIKNYDDLCQSNMMIIELELALKLVRLLQSNRINHSRLPAIWTALPICIQLFHPCNI